MPTDDVMEPEVEFIDLEETVLSANKCSCSASDDNPY
jgi:hypothetical protein